MIQHTKKLLGARTLLFLGILYTFIITYVFVSPKPDLPEIDFLLSIDKIGHFIIHAILSLIWLTYFFVKKKGTLSALMVVSILIVCLTYGIVIEVYQQMYIASRQADMLDVIANSIGTLVGMILFMNVKKRIIF